MICSYEVLAPFNCSNSISSLVKSINLSKLKSSNWQYQVSVEESLNQTYDWFLRIKIIFEDP